VKIGIVACKMMVREIEIALKKFPEIDEVVFLKEGEHINPERLQKQVLAHLKAMSKKVDVIFLGYGHCHSLKGIGDEIDIPVVHPEADDCIGIMMTPQRYKDEVDKVPGTFFFTPGWATNMKKMMNSEEAKSFETPEKGLFPDYSRGLYIDTGIENNEHYVKLASELCETLNFKLEQTVTHSTILHDSLAKCVEIAKELEATSKSVR
jgi:hypothetical protein|tara:strand:+ start:8947 stop:9567 length:621 start_codon:yes stop_codon:yes gene_type:complete